MNVVFLLEVDMLLLVDDGMDRERKIISKQYWRFFTGIHTLNWVRTRGGKYLIQKGWVWGRSIHLLYIFESEGASPSILTCDSIIISVFIKIVLIRNYSHPLRAWWYYLVLRLFQFDRLQEEGPQRLFCKFYVNFSDKKDTTNEKKIQCTMYVFIDIISQYFGRRSFFSNLKKKICNYIFFWKKKKYIYIYI